MLPGVPFWSLSLLVHFDALTAPTTLHWHVDDAVIACRVAIFNCRVRVEACAGLTCLLASRAGEGGHGWRFLKLSRPLGHWAGCPRIYRRSSPGCSSGRPLARPSIPGLHQTGNEANNPRSSGLVGVGVYRPPLSRRLTEAAAVHDEVPIEQEVPARPWIQGWFLLAPGEVCT